MIVMKHFAITFDEPNPNWLCADNLKIALEQVCTNTKFRIVEVKKLEEELQYLLENKSW